MKRNPSISPKSASGRRLLHRPEAEWPEIDRILFRQAFETTQDVFEDHGAGSRLKPRTIRAIRYGYRRWLGWMSGERPDLLRETPEVRATPDTIKAFVTHLRATCSPRTVASQVGRLHDALRFMYPATDWTWLRSIKTRLERAVPGTPRKPILITSQRLIDASLDRLEKIDAEFANTRRDAGVKKLQALALRYRDALLVVIVTFLPLRRSNIELLEIGSTLRRESDVWSIHIPGEHVKNGEPIDADLPDYIGERVDRYISTYRPLICRSSRHRGFWASAKGCPAKGHALYAAFQKEAREALGLHLTLHDARRIGATTWVVHDPVNAAGAKDLLGDRSDRVFTQHYNMADSVEASRAMAGVIRQLKDIDDHDLIVRADSNLRSLPRYND